MSAFDDEFGLFGEDSEEAERRPTLGARRISGERDAASSASDERRPAREPKRERAPQPPRESRAPREQRPAPESHPPRGGRREGRAGASADPWAGHRRATELLGFVARKLVARPDDVAVELFTDETGAPVIELVVDPEDLGKVIGRNGRVAHALRTIVRATAEGRVSVDILDTDEAQSADDE